MTLKCKLSLLVIVGLIVFIGINVFNTESHEQINIDDTSVEIAPGIKAPPINSIPLYRYETEFAVYPDAWSIDGVRMQGHITFGYTLESREQLKQLINKYGYTWYADLAFDHYGSASDNFIGKYTAKDLIYGNYSELQGTDIIQTRIVEFRMYDKRKQDKVYPKTYKVW